MSARWSHISTAVNHGWGKIMPKSTPRHPEYSFRGPYGAYALATGLPMYHHASPVGGARTRKGGKSASRRRSYTRAALDGYGYTTAALEGTGDMSWTDVGDLVSGVGKNLNQQTMKAVGQLASKANMDITELLKDPGYFIE